MNIYDIKISEIADQYIEYINEMEENNLEVLRLLGDIYIKTNKYRYHIFLFISSSSISIILFNNRKKEKRSSKKQISATFSEMIM